MDDMLIFGSNIHVINETKNMLKSHFDVKDLGEGHQIAHGPKPNLET